MIISSYMRHYFQKAKRKSRKSKYERLETARKSKLSHNLEKPKRQFIGDWAKNGYLQKQMSGAKIDYLSLKYRFNKKAQKYGKVYIPSLKPILPRHSFMPY